MRKLFENLEISQFGNAGSKENTSDLGGDNRLFDQSEYLELAQFGRVLHDWRPKGKQKKIKQEENK